MSQTIIVTCYGQECPIKTHCMRAALGVIAYGDKENYKYDSTLDDEGKEIGCFHFVEIRGKE